MDILAGIWNYAAPFLVVLTVLVFVHELGHYLVARWCGVRVEVFSIGFGSELFGWNDKAGTRWKISWIPFGGYVKFFGDADAASTPGAETGSMSAEERAESFHHKPLHQRAAVVVAGPAANFLFAIVVLAGMFSIYGQPYTPPVVAGVVPGSAADAAGFQPGDRVLEVNGSEVQRFEQLRQVVMVGLEAPLDMLVSRNGASLHLEARPQIVEIDDGSGNMQRIGRLGIQSGEPEFARHDPLTAIWQAVKETGFVTTATLQGVGQMISGARDASELSGPVGIVRMSGQAAEYGVLALVNFMVFLSISLGLINLFPIPMLDGGHLLFYAIEAIRGKPLGERSMEYGFRIGLFMVLSLMAFATWQDVAKLSVGTFLSGLFS
ncbi:RIP metalloprotease RseP [Oceanibacterium hippocampi]|uniref:Zinc metalloprotease n=1 Tax=Oceanibacterium hippocampi TaxID=745714 RepID=A0A1Y5T739_9PROT|nr:RIP metalloprotease RseP [Oceanibacterium hippocampi]SLN54045.1 Metalloprotease MmpA [Oceanibacterium hippocampi]